MVFCCFYLEKLSTRLTICWKAAWTLVKLRSSYTLAELRITSLDVASLKFIFAETSLTYLISSAYFIISATVGSKFSNSLSSWKLIGSLPPLLINYMTPRSTPKLSKQGPMRQLSTVLVPTELSISGAYEIWYSPLGISWTDLVEIARPVIPLSLGKRTMIGLWADTLSDGLKVPVVSGFSLLSSSMLSRGPACAILYKDLSCASMKRRPQDSKSNSWGKRSSKLMHRVECYFLPMNSLKVLRML